MDLTGEKGLQWSEVTAKYGITNTLRQTPVDWRYMKFSNLYTRLTVIGFVPAFEECINIWNIEIW